MEKLWSLRERERAAERGHFAWWASLVFLLLSTAWIYLSDLLVAELVPPERMRLVQTGKGVAYVLAASLLVGLLVRWGQRLARHQTGRYLSLVENAPDAIFVNRDDRVVLVNRACAELFGAEEDPRELLGRSPLSLFAEEEHPAIVERIETMRRTLDPVPVREERIVRLDGSRLVAEVTAAPFRDADGGVAIHVMLRDVSERKRVEEERRRLTAELEARVARRTAELDARNRELETFTYSVSHDLKAPLRGLDGYSRLLLEEHGERLDEEGRRFLSIIRQSARQMGQLIDDLLEYSRLERRQFGERLLDPREVVEGLLAAEPLEEGIDVRVEVVGGPVRADPDGVRMVLRNLLHNAAKFSRGQPQRTVEVGGREVDGGSAYRLWVRDDGVGFDMKYHDRIFEIFQRLHRAEEYPGTGVGLAMVRKAAERMGGRVWAESEPGAGSTFYLELGSPPVGER